MCSKAALRRLALDQIASGGELQADDSGEDQRDAAEPDRGRGLREQDNPQDDGADSADAGPPRNRASLASVGVIAAAYLLWVAAWVAWSRGNPANLTFVFGWLSTAGFAIAAILALIGLSDPARERGKLWGLLTLALLLLAAGAFVAQVRHFTAARDTTPPDIASPNR